MQLANTPYFERPLFFFDQGRFRKALTEGVKPPLTIFKDAFAAADTQMAERFREGEDVRTLVHERALFIDCLLHYAWYQYDWPNGISLLAVGGYGRGELHPHSDIDLLILTDGSAAPDTIDNIERLVAFLWDLGLDIGHSVRTIDHCLELAAEDITVATNLMECRTVVGDDSLRERLTEGLAPDKLWPAEQFFSAKYAEQCDRHNKQQAAEYILEPNIKNSPGGLRDIQTIGWVAKRYFQVRTLKQLQGQGFFTEDEFAILQSGEDFLWRVRYGLHLLAGRAEERLLFDYQRELAKQFGYVDSGTQLAVEQFMHNYYRIVMALRELNDVLLQFLNEAILQRGQHQVVKPINERFQLRDNTIEVTQTRVFTETPSALLEIFVLMAEKPEIRDVRASTIRLIREHRHLIDERFRADPCNAELFMQLLRSPRGLSTQLSRMTRYGILGRYLPEFGRVTGQMQHDLFHIYTVDAHTLQVVRNMRAFRSPEAWQKFPIAAEILSRMRKPELLYIAGLYHDIAKGRGGDHSKLGVADADAFCRRHQLPGRDRRLVCWLVEKHLLMSHVSQKQDISDPEVVHDFAREVGDREHLDYLYALTVADINATNPDLWNSWRASLMRQLYQATQRALRRGLENPIDREEIIEETRSQARNMLRAMGLPIGAVENIWAQMGEDYFVRESADNITWHTAAIHQLHSSRGRGDQKDTLVLTRNSGPGEHDGATEVFVYTPDRANVFAAVVTGLDMLNLNIHDARLYSSASGYTLDTFYVLDESGQPLLDEPRRLEQIRNTLQRELALVEDYSKVIQRRTPRRLKMFELESRAQLSTDPGNHYSTLEITSADRPGLLARIARIFLAHDLRLHNAKISTLGERVEDIFHITDARGQPLLDEAANRKLEEVICRELDAHQINHQ
ncbi:[protein-PII] uridylyltransferase [Microbulbifer thermotolerans]|uniref:Bifunctional uridylyltransferase/uridylyl-removing enzyme n=1 Tax=Microbulbifer thermotolerans TaxID=252514 RepID=A0AB35HUT9_MICTH|nr:[protein-PII] uridylyltransferase [Microbulbifer thermotolerans]MCX2778810.1 [protein-PII] uridylyltransferase [Microbulbifer thermotolerans]MCX2781918.1 [protein-PII] uridylyltransferase [Microbulbifer thermotolerans]MCX2793696.1 [protein-PII] uridylyltransferase [Microbulbifer thermotolerans]MCX2800880.1 [protein-PII] uridylyltransferase [Microbulbifer thermotolerans]MCX2804115.1 [protein-PII] uridylyltransferase [Microbulbifer thermotolerans]